MTESANDKVLPPATAGVASVTAAPGAPPAPAARDAPPKQAGRAKNPLRELIALGRMPVILELHLTESDQTAYLSLRQRHLARSFELPNLVILGQYLRELDPDVPDLSAGERSLVRKLQTYADLICSGAIDLAALDDGSRGRATLDNAIAAELLIGLGAEPARLLINMVARNRHAEQIRQRLRYFADLGVRNVLMLTGDLPVDPGVTAVFPLDSIGMLELGRDMLIEGSLPDEFWLAAAGHPNPDADPDGLRTLHKALAGARVIVTQAIYSIDQFKQWMTSLQQVGALDMVHILAEIIPITSGGQLRAIADVPGMRVPRELIAELDAAERINHAAEQGGQDEAWVRVKLRREGVRVTRQLLHEVRRVPGVGGFYLGCIKSFEPHLELLKEAPLLPESSEGSHKVRKLSGAERQRAVAELPAVEAYLRRERRNLAGRAAGWRRWARRLTRWERAETLLQWLEWPKVPLFGCKQCDRCDLSPDALVCPRGCAKQMSHGPCGAPRLVNGRMLCEDTSRECTWAHIRERRTLYGVPLADQLASKPAPSAGFYEGRKYSAVLPVLIGDRGGPNWTLAWRAPVAHLRTLFHHSFVFPSEGSPRSLVTLVAAQRERLAALVRRNPSADDEELLLKLLSLIDTPAAVHLIESRLVELGLPGEGAIADLSLRERFLMAEAMSAARRRLKEAPATANSIARCDELLRVIPEHRRLRQAVRREMADGLIRHIAAMGVDVHYTPAMLEGRHVDNFLSALTMLKDELQVARPRWSDPHQRVSVNFLHIHYRNHFQASAAVHAFVNEQGVRDGVGLQIDMKAFANAARFRANLRSAIDRVSRGEPESAGAIVLENYVPLSKSLAWRFNAEFWKRLREFETATGVHYDASIGGSTDHNLAYARSVARAFYDRVQAHGLQNETLYALEIGVASTHRARAFLGEYKRLCELHGHESYRNLRYLLADFSETILERGAKELSTEHPWLDTVKIEASDPVAALAKYRGRIIHAHLCNVYDNLPTDQLLWVNGSWRLVEQRLYLTQADLDSVAAKHGLSDQTRTRLEHQLVHLREDPENAVSRMLDELRADLVAAGRSEVDYVHPWMSLVAALKFDERYVHVGSPASLLSEAGVDAAELDAWLQAHAPSSGSLRMHLNAAALAGFAQLVSVLHPHGLLEVIDLFVQRLDEYGQAFKGPAKYDGSVVNWLNGPLFRWVGERRGYQVRFQPFRPFDPKSPSVVLLAQAMPHEPSHQPLI